MSSRWRTANSQSPIMSHFSAYLSLSGRCCCPEAATYRWNEEVARKCFSRSRGHRHATCACHNPKGPDILQTKSKNKLIWCHFELNSGRNKVRFEFVSAVRYSSPKQSFVQSEFFFLLLKTFELPLVRGNYSISGCVLELHLLWCTFFFPRLISHSTKVRQGNIISKSLATCIHYVE